MGKNVRDPAADEFFDVRSADSDAVRHETTNRIILIGESLFNLRSCQPFNEFRRRMKTRKLRSAFFELLAAKQFFKAGFDIHGRPEIGIRGEDFDFTAIRNSTRINVEVTVLTADSFSENTILNALRQKRKQLPETAPAVIYCVMPEHWFKQPDNWNLQIPKIAETFLAGTRRINVVVFWTEIHIDKVGDSGAGGGLLLMRNFFANPNPRKVMAGTDFLFGGKPINVGLHALQTGTDLDALVKEANSSEFFRWVDYHLPAKRACAWKTIFDHSFKSMTQKVIPSQKRKAPDI